MLKNFWLQQTWGNGLKLNPNQLLPEAWSSGTNQKFQVTCDCGRVFSPIFKNLTSKSTKSCGKCSYKPIAYWLQQTWGDLRLFSSDKLPTELSPSSGQNLDFICVCGNHTTPKMVDVTLGRTASCGHCNNKTKEQWLQLKWGKYSLVADQRLPAIFNLMSDREFRFQCECGCIKNLRGSWVCSGNAKSCGQCDWKLKTWWLSQKWGSLRLNPNQLLPEKWGGGCNSKFLFLCDCGRTTNSCFAGVVRGQAASCGKCAWRTKTYWLLQKWGLVRVDPDQPLPDEWGVSRVVHFLCDCGKRLKSNLFNVIDGRTNSCGCTKAGKSKFSPAHEIYDFVKPFAPDAIFSGII